VGAALAVDEPARPTVTCRFLERQSQRQIWAVLSLMPVARFDRLPDGPVGVPMQHERHPEVRAVCFDRIAQRTIPGGRLEWRGARYRRSQLRCSWAATPRRTFKNFTIHIVGAVGSAEKKVRGGVYAPRLSL
jgi:hypothetical protein